MSTPSNYSLSFHHYNESSILINWPQQIEGGILEDIMQFKSQLSQSSLPIVQIINAYASVLVQYATPITDMAYEIAQLSAIYHEKKQRIEIVRNHWKIPVCYDQAHGVDLMELAAGVQLSPDEVIQKHSTPIYTVYFIGFLPGFLYLGGLDKQLYFPRKSNPRLKVPAGSVSIGNHQTGVYPNESPGGWNIIGNTPISFFNPQHTQPCFAKTGDTLCFYPVSQKEHEAISVQIKEGKYQLEPTT